MIVRWNWLVYYTCIILLSSHIIVLHGTAEAALVKSYGCGNLKQSDIDISALFTQAIYDEDEELLQFRILANSSQNITDVNYTTNLYTTLHVQIEFTGGQIIDKYLRLCDYVDYYHPDEFPFPLPLPGGPNSGNSSFMPPPSGPPPSGPPPSGSGFPPFSNPSGSFMSPIPMTSTTSTISSTVPSSTTTQDVVVPQANGKRQWHRREVDSDGDSTICPLTPGQLFEINYNISIGSYHKFGSYDLRFSVISADSSQRIIFCNQFYVTPRLPQSATKGLGVGMTTLAVWMAVTSCFTLIFSPYQESKNPFLLFCSTICNAPLLNQLSPLFDDFVIYMHYLFFMAGLDVQYPGFYQPLLSSIKWIALLSTSFYSRNTKDSVQDNIYETYGSSSLGSLFLLSDSDVASDAWSSFMCLFAIIMAIMWLGTFLATLGLWLYNQNNPDYHDFKWKILYHSAGLLNRLLYFCFAIPFLVLTLYLCTASDFHPIYEVKEHWALGVGIVFFILWLLGPLYFISRYLLSKNSRHKLYSSLKVILLWGALYHKYEPARLYYFVVEGLEILTISVIIGLLRNCGIAQVTVILVVELLLLGCLIIIKPYYAKTRLNLYKIALAVAKFVLCVLTVPFIRELNISEKNRTYVAYLQAFLHLVVVIFVFFVPSIYGLLATVNSIRQYRNGTLKFSEKTKIDVPLSSRNSHVELVLMRDDHSGVYHYNNNNVNSNVNNNVSSNNNFEYSYYREPHLLNWSNSLYRLDSNMTSTSTADLKLTDNRAIPFVKLLSENGDSGAGNNKIVDYSVREVDKYYNASRILDPDPEVRLLWDAREGRKYNEVDDRVLASPSSSTTPLVNKNYYQQQQQQRQPRFRAPLTKKLHWLFNKKKPAAPKSFVVERPRQIIARTAPQDSSVSFDDITNTEDDSFLLQKEFYEEENLSETATRASMKHSEEEDMRQAVIEEESDESEMENYVDADEHTRL